MIRRTEINEGSRMIALVIGKGLLYQTAPS